VVAPPLSDDELRDFVPHITYEVTWLVGITQVLQGQPPADQVVRNALIEAALAHLRALDDFLRTPANKPPLTCNNCGHQVVQPTDDVTAQHYLSSWEPTPVLNWKLREAVNAQLQHLALRREAGVSWDLGRLTIGGCEAVVAFVDALRAVDAVRAAWFDAAHQAAVSGTAQRTMVFSMEATTTSPSGPVTVTRSEPPRRPPFNPRGR
jgi:hypothetical protein